MFMLTCPNCAGIYAISEAFRIQAQQIGHFKKTWACPYCGSKRGYGESSHENEVRDLKKKLEQQQNTTVYYRQRHDELQTKVEHLKKSRDGVRGALAKVKKRVANSVCPCCNRTFTETALQRHLKTQHPNWITHEQ